LTDSSPSPEAQTATTPPSPPQLVEKTEQALQPLAQSQELKQSVEQTGPGVSTSPEVPPTVVTGKPLPPIPQTQPFEATSPATAYPPTQAQLSPQSTNLPTDIESSILDATQSSINSAEPKSRQATVSPSEKAKKNFTNAFTAVRGFLVRSSSIVVEKINQKLEEMDEEMLKAMEEEELLNQVEKNQIPNGEIDGGAKEVQNGRIITEEGNPGGAVTSGGPKVKDDMNEDDYNRKREELLGTSAPTATNNQNNIKYATVPSSSKSAARVSQKISTRSVFAETADALNERGEKLGQLNDQLEDMSNSSNEFARLAKQLAEKEANKKWYQLF